MKRYAVIYADPPWSFEVWAVPMKPITGSHGGRSAADHYDTMTLDQLKAMPVSDLAADDCALFMWIVWPSLPDALELGKAWGFEYKTLGFDWLKQTPSGAGWHMGMGYWTRANSEACLLFTRGTPKRRSAGVRQLIAEDGTLPMFPPPVVAPVGVHSAKPYAAYERIMALLDGPYLELFARVKYEGWDVWGNEAPDPIMWEPFAEAGA